VREPEEEMVHTISFKIRVPRVIVLLLFDRMPKKEVKFTRANIFERDKNTCQYCGKVFDRRDLNLDHVIRATAAGSRAGKTSCVPASRVTRARETASRIKSA